MLLGDFQGAAEACHEAVDAGRESANVTALTRALTCLGWAYYGQGRYAEALELCQQAVAMTREKNLFRELAGQLSRQGTLYRALKRHEEALASYEEALRIFEEIGNLRSQRDVLLDLGHLHVDWGLPEKALGYTERARALMTRENEQIVDAGRLLINARAERQLGNLETAQIHVEQALVQVESVRANIETAPLRLHFLVYPRRSYYDFYVDLLMERRDFVNPSERSAFDRRAFAVAERGKARVLLDLLHDSRGNLRPAPGGPLMDRGLATPLGLAEVRELLDPETILLAFSLGEERSFLWRVGVEGVDSFVLPPGDELDRLARDYHLVLKESFKVEHRVKLKVLAWKLSEAILADVEATLEDRRLVVVPDGALHYVPFAALVQPSTGQPLVVDHEVVTLPSASSLAFLRKASSDSPNPWSVVALGDPVSERSDQRLTSRTSGLTFRSGSDTAEYPRLPWSKDEVEEILSLVAPGRKRGFMGFDATRETVLSGGLKGFDVVHFAVHAVVDGDRPGFSGLVLSLYDRQGRRRDGFLRLNEVYGLDLPAELVVLSACSTALGREIHGEGLVGLTRGFMYAGASRVMVSLWDVSDQGTAELMKRFYRALLEDGQPPAAALRTAQKSMLSDPRFSQPYYWATFVLQGDWR